MQLKYDYEKYFAEEKKSGRLPPDMGFHVYIRE